MNVVSGVLQCFPQQLAKCNANDEDAILFLLTTTALLVSQKQAVVLSALKDNLRDILGACRNGKGSVIVPSKHETLTQYWIHVGQAVKTVVPTLGKRLVVPGLS